VNRRGEVCEWAKCHVRVIHGSSQNCIQANIDKPCKPCILRHMDVELIEVQLQGKKAHTHDDTGDGHHSEWLKMVWVEFGCPGHGKGLGAMVKTNVTLDIMHGKERTMTGKITSPILVAQHLRATFGRKEWLMEHVNTQINEVVVMHLSAEKVIRPPVPPDV
jgi:hypothetical protein